MSNIIGNKWSLDHPHPCYSEETYKLIIVYSINYEYVNSYQFFNLYLTLLYTQTFKDFKFSPKW